MKMFTWSQKPFFLATAHAESVAEARRLLVETEELGESGDGSCPEHDRARRIILEMNPNIWTGANAEFALTDSAEVKEYEHNFHVMGEEIKQLKARAEAAEQSLAAAQKYATELCVSMARAYPAVPDWKPLEDLYGVLMQIDNMWCGYRDRLTAAQEELKVERERLDWLTDIAAPSGDLELKRDLDKWWLFVSSAAYSQDDPDAFDNPRAAIDAARSQKGGTDGNRS